jgi:hypothetical protein
VDFQVPRWHLRTVYDWKEAVDPRTVATAEFQFHIGGNSPRALEAFERLTGLKAESAYAP